MAESGMSPDSIPKDRLHDPETWRRFHLLYEPAPFQTNGRDQLAYNRSENIKKTFRVGLIRRSPESSRARRARGFQLIRIYFGESIN
jgi:hypothetical protein